MWQPDGRSLTYLRGVDVMSVSLSADGAGTPTKLFALEPTDILLDVARDGQLLVLRRHVPPAPGAINLVVNWFEELRALVQ